MVSLASVFLIYGLLLLLALLIDTLLAFISSR